MLLGDLLADPELGLLPLVGANHRDRPIRGLYITDLLDPRRYLDGGELVLSGLAWHSGPDDSERFVAAIADAGVAALAVGTARLGDAPADLVDACRRYGLPTFQVPVSVSFNTLAEYVRRSMSGRELVAAVASGANLERVLGMAAREFDADCWVIAPTGWTVGADAELSDPELSDPERCALVQHFLAGESARRTVWIPTGPFVLWSVSPDTGPSHAGSSDIGPSDTGLSAAEPSVAQWFIAVRGDQARWTEEQRVAATELGTAVALLRARIDQARRIAGRSIESILRRLLDGTASPPEVAAGLETVGLSTENPIRAVVLTMGDNATAVAVLHEIVAATGIRAVTLPLWDGASALFVDEEQHLLELGSRLRTIATDIEPGLGRRKLAIGLSDISAANGLRGALDEASHALRLATRQAGGARVVTGGELTSHQVLLASVPDTVRATYRERLLSGLTEYDRAHHSDLLGTLRAFLECSGSWSRCAEQLHVHVNTLRYRIGRIEQITGRDLSAFPTRVDFYLALEVDRGASEGAGDGP